MDNGPKISEADFQREKLRRELQDVVTMLDEAISEEDTEIRQEKDLQACLRLASIEPKKFMVAIVAIVEPNIEERIKEQKQRTEHE